VHLYTVRFVSASATTLRVVLDHDPNNEGGQNDFMWPPAHSFRQQVTVDIPIDGALRGFACVVFAATTPPTSYPVDASLLNLNYGAFSLVGSANGTYRWQNVSDLCAAPSLPVVTWNVTTSLPDLAVMIPLSPDTRNLAVGASVSGWFARGLVGNDEEAELLPVIPAKVIDVTTTPCPDLMNC
jgi:hypothetical protein